MATHDIRTHDRDSLARFLGWFSIGLGTAELVAPGVLRRVIGGGDRRVIRLMGLRELAHGAGILTSARPTGWVWSRVGGDALDLAALGVVARHGRMRTFGAIANVLSIATADVLEGLHLAKKKGEPHSGRRVRKAVTINKPQVEVERAWDLSEYTPTFANAPGGRGTEVAVELVEDPPAGDFGLVAQKLSGRDPATDLADELRRFKSRVETGEVMRSDSTPDGHRLGSHLKQRPAQPQEEVHA
jgi:uncharacterized membrane protein